MSAMSGTGGGGPQGNVEAAAQELDAAALEATAALEAADALEAAAPVAPETIASS